eukprot:2562147-Rhodomonas_salina.1
MEMAILGVPNEGERMQLNEFLSALQGGVRGASDSLEGVEAKLSAAVGRLNPVNTGLVGSGLGWSMRRAVLLLASVLPLADGPAAEQGVAAWGSGVGFVGVAGSLVNGGFVGVRRGDGGWVDDSADVFAGDEGLGADEWDAGTVGGWGVIGTGREVVRDVPMMEDAVRESNGRPVHKMFEFVSGYE